MLGDQSSNISQSNKANQQAAQKERGSTEAAGRLSAASVAEAEPIRPDLGLAHFAALVEFSDDAIVSKTLAGVITSWNPAAEKLFGYPAQEAIGQTIFAFIPPDRVQEEREILARIAGGESIRHIETVRVHKNGRRIDVSLAVSPIKNRQGQVIGVSKIARDISERKQSEQRFQALLKEVTDLKAALDEHAIVAITDPQGKITYVNDKFCAISQYTREELLGQDHRLINSGHHPKEFIRELWGTIGRGKVWRGEIKNRAKDGTFYWVDTTVVPFLDDAGRPRQYVAIRTDITERKRAEEEIRLLNSQLEVRVAQRTAELEVANRELEAFSYSVSHDLRAPLRAVNGFTRILVEDFSAGLPVEARHYLERANLGSQRMGQLIDDLLAFSRLSRQPVSRQPVNTGALVKKIWDELRPQWEGRQLELRLDALPDCQADPALLKQVWINLLANAIKYSRPRELASVEVGCTDEHGEAVYFVRDNGVGFDMQFADKLFGVFQRLHRMEDFEGTGVGLAIVQRVIHRHGGRVWAEAKVGQGATFYFTITSNHPI